MDPNQNPPQEQILYNQQAQNDLAPIPSSSFPLKKIIIIAVGVVISLIVLIAAYMWFTRPKEPIGPVTLTYWGLWENEQLYESIIADFEREHPNIKIEYVYQEDIKSRPEGYIDYVRSRIKNGTGPDIFRFHNSWMSQMQPYLLPFPDDIAQATGLKKGSNESEFYQVVVDDMLHDDKLFYGVPLGVDVLSLFVNDELFERAGQEVPKDWYVLMDTAWALTVDDEETPEVDQSGIALGTFDNIAHASDIIALLLIQSGVDIGDLLSEDQEIAEGERTDAARALDYYTCFASESDSCQRVWNDTMEQSTLAFGKGKVGMYFGYTWDISVLRSINPELKYSIHPVPVLTGEGDVVMNQTVASYWAEGVSRNTKHQKEAFTFLQYLSSKESLTKLYTERGKRGVIGSVYPRRDMASLMNQDPRYSSFIKQLDNGRSTIFSSNTYDGAEITAYNNYLGAAVRQVLGRSSSESAIDGLKKGILEVISRRNAITE